MTKLLDAGWSTSTASCIPTPPTTPTPGGAIAARPGPRTSVAARLPDRDRATGEGRARAAIHKATRFSDHAPLTIDYDLAF